MRKGKTFTGFQDFYLKAKARMWPCLSYMCHVHSTAESLNAAPLPKQERAREWAAKDAGLRLAWDRREAEHLHVRRGNTFTGFEGLLPESQGHNLAVPVLYVPYSLDSGLVGCLHMWH